MASKWPASSTFHADPKWAASLRRGASRGSPRRGSEGGRRGAKLARSVAPPPTPPQRRKAYRSGAVGVADVPRPQPALSRYEASLPAAEQREGRDDEDGGARPDGRVCAARAQVERVCKGGSDEEEVLRCPPVP